MIFLFRFIIGYVRFNFTGGFTEQFLSSCFEKGIEIREVCKTASGVSASCSPKTYKRLHAVARESGGKTKIYKKVGLPFILPSLRYRLGFFVGLFSFVLIIAFLNSFVWSVEVVGNTGTSTASILFYLEDNGVKSGVPWSSFDRQRLAWKMLADFDSLAWAHINRDGAKAVVEVSEATPPDMDYSRDRLEGNTVVSRQLEATAYRDQNRVSVAKTDEHYALNFFGLSLPLYFGNDGSDVVSKTEKPLTVKGEELPVSLSVFSRTTYQAEPYSLTDDALTALAERKLDILKEQELGNFEIINESVSVELSEDRAVATGNYVVRIKE